MFAYDTNLFYSHQNIKNLFSTVNSELECTNQWFKVNKLSLNKYTLLHKKSTKTEIYGIPNLKIGGKNIENTSSIKFLAVMLDKNILWNNHVKTVESRLAKNIGLVNRAS